jgi:hypothetical protein
MELSVEEQDFISKRQNDIRPWALTLFPPDWLPSGPTLEDLSSYLKGLKNKGKPMTS